MKTKKYTIPQIEEFLFCPMKYYWTELRKKKVPRRRRQWLDEAVHQLLTNYYRKGEWDYGDLPEDTDLDWHWWTDKYFFAHRPFRWEILSIGRWIEKEFQVENHLIVVETWLDLVVKNDLGEIWIVDFQTIPRKRLFPPGLSWLLGKQAYWNCVLLTQTSDLVPVGMVVEEIQFEWRAGHFKINPFWVPVSEKQRPKWEKDIHFSLLQMQEWEKRLDEGMIPQRRVGRHCESCHVLAECLSFLVD